MNDDARDILKGLLGGGYEPKHLREQREHVLVLAAGPPLACIQWRFSCPRHSNPAFAALQGVIGQTADGHPAIVQVLNVRPGG